MEETKNTEKKISDKSIFSKKYLIFVVILCLVGAITSVTVTYSWFSMNRKVDEESLALSVKVSPNLIISSDSSSILTMNAGSANSDGITVGTTSQTFLACTHYGSNSSGQRVMLDGLYYLTNTEDIDRYTGLCDTPSLNAVSAKSAADREKFYVDFAVYVASTDVQMENSKLVITVTDTEHDESDQSSYRAASVDFYLGEIDDADFIGTLNAAGRDALVNDGSRAKSSLDVILDDDIIPCNTAETGEKYIKISMRCYFDGALLQNPTTAYINSDTVSPEDVVFDILISAADRE